MKGSPESEAARARAFLFTHLRQTGQAPTLKETASGLDCELDAVKLVFAELARTGTLVLDGESGEIWRAAPFCAVPTEFEVRTSSGVRYRATCAWDAFGVPAALGESGEIRSSCACCNQPMTLTTGPFGVAGNSGVVHFAVPTRHWYDDLVFT